MDKNRTAYDIAMLFAQEHLRRMDGDLLTDVVRSAPQVEHVFVSAYEVLAGTLPEDVEM